MPITLLVVERRPKLRLTHLISARDVYLVICVVCSALLLAGCRVPGAVRPTVKIGLVAPFEGRYRYVGYDLFPAVRLALREANAAGGVDGVFVELVAYDDAADPALADQQAQKLVVDPDVVAVIGHFRDATTAAAVPAYVEADLPLLAPAVLNPDLGGGDVVFQPGPDADAVAAAMLEGVGEAALVTDGGALGQALLDAASAGGVLLAPVVSPGAPGWVDVVLSAGLETVVCATDPVTAGEVVVALRAAGWSGTLLGGPALGAEDFAAVAADAAVGALFVTPWPPFAAPDEGFVATYTAISGGPHPGRLALPAYEAVGLVLEALRMDVAAHRAPSREGMAMALAAVVAARSAADDTVYRYRIGASGMPEFVSSFTGKTSTRTIDLLSSFQILGGM